MTSDRVLTLIALIWFVLALLYLAAVGVIHVEAAPDPGGEDVPGLICGTWTYYSPRLMTAVRDVRGLTPCHGCAGMAATVNQNHLGRYIEIWFRGEWRGWYHVVDVGDGANRAGLVGEVDYQTAMRWNRAGPWWGCYRVVAT